MRGQPVGASRRQDAGSDSENHQPATQDGAGAPAAGDRQRRLKVAVASCLEQLEGRLLFSFTQPAKADAVRIAP